MTNPAPSTQPEPFPRLDDHIVRGREEMLHGRVIPSPAAAFPNDPKTAEVACVAWGLARGLGKGIEALCEVLEIPIEDEHIELLDSLDWPRLQDALYTLRTQHRWP